MQCHQYLHGSYQSKHYQISYITQTKHLTRSQLPRNQPPRRLPISLLPGRPPRSQLPRSLLPKARHQEASCQEAEHSLPLLRTRNILIPINRTWDLSLSPLRTRDSLSPLRTRDSLIPINRTWDLSLSPLRYSSKEQCYSNSSYNNSMNSQDHKKCNRTQLPSLPYVAPF